MDTVKTFETVVPSVAQMVFDVVDICRFAKRESLPLQVEWGSFVFVPQFKGKSLAQVASGIRSMHFFAGTFESLPVATQKFLPVAASDWASASPPVWNAPVIAATFRWFEAACTFLIHFDRAKYLFLAAEDAPEAIRALSSQETNLSKALSDAANEANAALIELRREIDARLKSNLTPIDGVEDILGRLHQCAAVMFPMDLVGEKPTILDGARYLEWLNSLASAPNLQEVLAEIVEKFTPVGAEC